MESQYKDKLMSLQKYLHFLLKKYSVFPSALCEYSSIISAFCISYLSSTELLEDREDIKNTSARLLNQQQLKQMSQRALKLPRETDRKY